MADRYTVDAVALEGFIADWNRYVAGDPKMPFLRISEGLVAVIDSAQQAQQPAAAVPEGEAFPLMAILRICGLKEAIDALGKAPRKYAAKIRLFAVACARESLFRLEDSRWGKALDVAERYARNESTDEELRLALADAREVDLGGAHKWVCYAADAVTRACAPDAELSAANVAYGAMGGGPGNVKEKIRQHFIRIFGGEAAIPAAAVPEGWVAIVADLVRHIERETCMHEETYRGGAIWEICRGCGAKWADDKGGKPEFTWPECVETARAMLAAAERKGDTP